jgi:hypothetical protein
VRSVRINGKIAKVHMARQVLGLEFGDKRQADHIDHNTLDNSRPNLRIVTNQENQYNRNPKGYCWNKLHRKYMAYIKSKEGRENLGYYDTKEEARKAYLKAKRKVHKIKEHEK